MDWLAWLIEGWPRPYLFMAIGVLVVFVGWVITSERRTRHLVQLIRAWRTGRR
ncbi:hypothetical protein [Micromonospora profundi]|uniref:hypothetical protein n=1 Tax=Micromonospora profundi TaxID=1420889 RepID=UPI00381D27D5